MSSIFVIMGAPGTGKRIQGGMLAEASGCPQISINELLWETARTATPLGRELRLVQAAGRPITDDLVAAAIRQRTTQPDCADGYVLNGYPRTLDQARRLDALALSQDKEVRVFELTVPRTSLLKRLSARHICTKCRELYDLWFNPPKHAGICDRDGAPLTQRPGAQESSMITEVTQYEQAVRPLVSYYFDSGRLLMVNAARAMEDVFFDLCLSATGRTSGA